MYFISDVSREWWPTLNPKQKYTYSSLDFCAVASIVGTLIHVTLKAFKEQMPKYSNFLVIAVGTNNASEQRLTLNRVDVETE